MSTQSGWPRVLAASAALGVLALGQAVAAPEASKPGDAGQATIESATPRETLPSYEVAGFRDTRFGMTESEVRKVAAKEFRLQNNDFTLSTNPVEGTGVLTARVAKLDPGPGPAHIGFIFGHTSKRLIQVNVVWGEDLKAHPEVKAMLAAGERLERYFAGYKWRKDAARAGIPVGPNTVVLFAGDDEKTGAVRLIIDGIRYQVKQQDGKKSMTAKPK